ncbi:putative quinol monooxygenase [Candidatus Epulonipiscium viviparus]|uniref:putative quinol monooxygenase n=1 Tax=Candidatus Epulonipiscium viviparus TaxID=420336 RepID=UPI00016C0A38|nr:antibiotic biosynthesis monooxygenase [Candidatus Epulopiscium viviparus]
MLNKAMWIIEGKIKPGKIQAYLDIMKERIDIVQKEDGIINYEWALGEDEESITIRVEYSDSATARMHLIKLANFADHYLKLIDLEKILVYSDLSPDLRDAISSLNPIYMNYIGGFSKSEDGVAQEITSEITKN